MRVQQIIAVIFGEIVSVDNRCQTSRGRNILIKVRAAFGRGLLAQICFWDGSR